MTEQTTSTGALPDFSKGTLVDSFSLGGKRCDLLADCPALGSENFPDGLSFKFRYCLLVIDPDTKALTGVLSHEVSMFGTEALSYTDSTGNRSSLGQVDSNTSPKIFLKLGLEALSDKNGMFSKNEIEAVVNSVGNQKTKPRNQELTDEVDKVNKVKEFLRQEVGIKKRINKKAVSALFALLVSVVGIWYVVTPHSYEDCILKNLKAGMAETAVVSVRTACANKFVWNENKNKQQCVDKSLTPEEISEIKGEGWLTNYGYFKANLYNGNRDFYIHDIIVSVEDKKTGKAQEYYAGGKVDPLTASEISAKISPTPEKFGGWKVVSAKKTICP